MGYTTNLNGIVVMAYTTQTQTVFFSIQWEHDDFQTNPCKIYSVYMYIIYTVPFKDEKVA